MSISENMLMRVLTGMGINVPELMKLFELFGTEIRDIRSERQAFKTSAQNVVADFRARLDRIEARQDEILARLPPLRIAYDAVTSQPQMNGTEHE